MENIFYNDWSTIGVTAAKGVLIYIALIAMLRISGKRSLSKFNIFDFVITIAIGSIFASTLTRVEAKIVPMAMVITKSKMLNFDSERFPLIRSIAISAI